MPNAQFVRMDEMLEAATARKIASGDFTKVPMELRAASVISFQLALGKRLDMVAPENEFIRQAFTTLIFALCPDFSNAVYNQMFAVIARDMGHSV